MHAWDASVGQNKSICDAFSLRPRGVTLTMAWAQGSALGGQYSLVGGDAYPA
jgi:hypothetical protein